MAARPPRPLNTNTPEPMGLTTTLNIGYAGKDTIARDLSTSSDTSSLTIADTFTDGTGANQANRKFEDTRTLAATTAETLDVYDFTAATDALGRTYAITKVRLLVIENTSTTAANILRVGGEGTAATWNSIFNGSDIATIDIAPGGSITLSAPSAVGYAVADTSNHLLKIDNLGATETIYKIVVVGSQ